MSTRYGYAMMVGMVEISILIERNQDLPFAEEWLQNVAREVLIQQNVSDPVELGLVITGDDQVHQLNRLYRGIDEPTDVLAFAAAENISEEPAFVIPPDGVRHLGEVIISYPQAVRQAAENQHPVEWEVALLITHGVLHLLGYDHDQPERESLMRARETDILSNMENLFHE